MDPSLGQSDSVEPQLEPFYFGRKAGFCVLAQVSYKTGVCYQVYLLPSEVQWYTGGRHAVGPAPFRLV